MRIVKLISLILSFFLFAGCLTVHKNKNEKQKNIQTYQLDLDRDRAPELIEVENRFETYGDILIRITKQPARRNDAPKVFSFKIKGQLNKVEFADMGCDGYKQMLIYYDTANNFMHLVIYKLQDDKVSQLFLASSNCDIEADFTTVPRVRVARNADGGRDCAAVSRGTDWESWAWDGEKFVKEQ
ncbi:MAG: hypothetical protein PHP17_00465 [Candidatus Omnitrophica bacterium]|nr:hypothetical protein [Candidatus Omnitrophota bacterium]